MTTTQPDIDQPTNQPTTADLLVNQWISDSDVVLNEGVPALAIELRGSISELAGLLRSVRELRKVILDAEHVVEDQLCELMAEQPGWWAETPKGLVKMHSGTKRTKWDHRALDSVLRQVIACDMPETLADPEQGIIVETSKMLEEIWQILRACETPSWKVTGLRPLQIDPDQFCTKETGRQTIELG